MYTSLCVIKKEIAFAHSVYTVKDKGYVDFLLLVGTPDHKGLDHR